MAAPRGNNFWHARSSHGRKPIFETPDALWLACCEFFQRVEDNPPYQVKASAFQGVVTSEKLPNMRAMTIAGLCIFLDKDRSAWLAYKSKEDFSIVTTRVEEIIYSQKFTGAAAELFNASIITRDLGLKEQSQVEDVTPDKANREKRKSRIKELLSRGSCQ